jgi:excisionase family DNA binding protein
LEVTSPDPRGYAKVKTAARYAGVSERTFRDYLKAGLPHFRLSTGTILIAYRDIDAWMEQFRVDRNKLDAVVDEVMEGLK